MNGVLCYAAFVGFSTHIKEIKIQEKCASICQDSSLSQDTRAVLLPRLLLADPKATPRPRAPYYLVVCTLSMFA